MRGDKGIQMSKSRFEAFSDGVFAIAITLLVLGFQPPKLAVVSEAAMTNTLLALWPQYLVYAATFVTVGIMWFNHYALFHHVRSVSYAALVGNLALLLFIAFLPFPTVLLGQYGLLASSVFFYALVMLLISLCFGVLHYVTNLQPDERGSILGFLRSRTAWNTLGPVAYVLSMVLAFFSPLASVLLIAAIAVFYMLPSTVSSALASGSANGAGERS
jgi:TMEM175 potassium channel family protein